jgi:hypothetical protein
MGIKPDVRIEHLAKFPEEENWLKPFLPAFDVTWARRRRAYNTELSQYFLKPHDNIREAFGFEQELMLVYSPYNTLEPRSIQAAEQFLQEEPARGRVERLTYLLVSDMLDAPDWIKNYVSGNQETRLIAAFASQDLRAQTADAWYVRNELRKQFYGRDLFDFRLPLEHDTYFFGRDAEVLAYRDAIHRGENRGLFGLRKMGKTSFLFKVERVARKERVARFLYRDCQSPDVRTLRWFELVADLADHLGRPGPKGETPAQVTRRFNDVVKAATAAERVVLVFDEIEYISPLAKQDTHWHQDFLSFWQTIRACQTRHRQLCFILAGVNPSVTEVSEYDRIPNPLFGIVSPQYLRGLPFEVLKRMVKTLGKLMGLSFEPDAIKYLHARYGGHPLLTRIACSLIHTAEVRAGTQRPVVLDRARLVARQAGRDAELSFYCEHVVSELRRFYDDEYAMLELLSRKLVADFTQLEREGMMVNHLREYGLLTEEHGVPRVAIPVVEAHVAEKGGGTYRVPAQDRAGWISQRATHLIQDMRTLEQRIRSINRPQLFGPTSFPEADRLAKIGVVASLDGFDAFINVMNRCFVEPIEKYGGLINRDNYFWDLRQEYPALHAALERVKVYRHNSVHILLNPEVETKLSEFLRDDLEGRRPGEVPDLWFALQQRVLDKLFMGIQVETAKLS